MIDLECSYCGNRFAGRHRKAMYCSRLCASRAFNVRRTADGRLTAQRRKRRAKISEYNRATRYRYFEHRTCEACGGVFSTSHRETRACNSEWCGVYLRTGRWPQRPVPVSHPIRSTPASRRSKKPRFAGAWCRQCGASFVMDRSAQHAMNYVFCTLRCGTRHGKNLRRYRKRGRNRAVDSKIARWQVFERDGWRCRLCGRKVRRDVTWDHPKSPVVDHIVPLSRGGVHESWNVQTAHRKCNELKGNRGGGEQFALAL